MLVFMLVNTNPLVNNGIESGSSADSGEIILDFGVQSEIKEQTFGIIIEAKRGDGRLKFDCVSCSKLGLTEVG